MLKEIFPLISFCLLFFLVGLYLIMKSKRISIINFISKKMKLKKSSQILLDDHLIRIGFSFFIFGGAMTILFTIIVLE